MKQAQQIASPNTVTTSTFFGPLRIKKTVGSTTTLYLYSGSKPIAEYLNGSLSKEYVYGGSTLLAIITGTSTTYHHPDHLSNRAETDSTGAPVRSFGHFPYGEVWYESPSDPLKFTSYSRDSGTGESGLDYAMFRNYNPGQGRFMNADLLAGHIGVPQSLNRYQYATDPIDFVDPLGLANALVQTCYYIGTVLYCRRDLIVGPENDFSSQVYGVAGIIGGPLGGGGTHLPLADDPQNKGGTSAII